MSIPDAAPFTRGQKPWSLVIALLASIAAPDLPAKSGAWITHPDESTAPNLWLAFRHSFELTELPTGPVELGVAVDSKYWLSVNDRLVVFEGGLKRGPNPRDTYEDRVEVGSYLQAGENRIEVLVWFWGREGFSHKNSGRAGLILESRHPGVPLATDSDWEVARHPAYYTTEKENPNYRLPEFNVAYDARKGGVFDWRRAETVGRPPVAPWNELVPRPVPLWRDSGLVAYEATAIERTADAVVVTARLPANLSITPWFRIRAPRAGGTVDIRTDNYIGGSEPNLRAEYLTREGEQEYESVGYLNGHEVRYRFPPDTEVLGVMYRETRYNTRYLGRFDSDRTRLDALWRKCENTLNVNLRDAIQDPDRERAQWWGDVVIILGEIFYTCDGTGTAAVAKALRNLFAWQKPDGVLYSPIPAGNWDKELPAQMLASIGEWGLWRYYEYTGDRALLEEVWPSVERYLALWTTDERGHAVHRPGGWSWYDWGSGVDVPLLDDLWLYQAWTAASKVASVIGRNDLSERYDSLAAALRAAIRRDHWKGDHFASDGYGHGPFDDRANGLAVCLGLVNAGEWARLRPLLFERRHSGPYMEKYVVEAFYRMGDHELGTQRMLERYSQMIDSPISTLWEGWVVGSGTYGGGSYNHGWSGWPLTLAGEHLAGVRPRAAGYAEVELAPRLAGFDRLDFAAPLGDDGLVELAFRRDHGVERYRVTLSDDRATVFVLPEVPGSVRLNGTEVRLDELPRTAADGYELRPTHRSFLVEVAPAQ